MSAPGGQVIEVMGGTAQERASRVAGALAEASVAVLVLRDGGAERVLRARETDLPGALAALAPGAIVASPDGAVRIESAGGGLRVMTRMEGLARALGTEGSRDG